MAGDAMARVNDRTARSAARVLRHAGGAIAVALLATACVAVAVPVPIPLLTGGPTSLSPAPAGAVLSRGAAPDGTVTVAYDAARMSAAEAEAFARDDCAASGLTLATLNRGAPGAATSKSASMTYTCRK